MLLDGGATHALRTAVDDKEWDSGVEVRVDLAQGWVTLRQLPWSKTLLSKEPVQPIAPLGIWVEIGYVVHWTSQSFELQDPTGCIVVTDLENGCPMVSTALGLELIKEVERHFVEKRARLAVLRGDKKRWRFGRDHCSGASRVEGHVSRSAGPHPGTHSSSSWMAI